MNDFDAFSELSGGGAIPLCFLHAELGGDHPKFSDLCLVSKHRHASRPFMDAAVPSALTKSANGRLDDGNA